MCNSRIIGLAIIAIGVVLLVFGLTVSHSFGVRIADGFTGEFTEQMTRYLAAGMASLVAGATLCYFGSRC